MDLGIRCVQIVNQPLFVWFQFYVVVQFPIVNNTNTNNNNNNKTQFKIGLLCFYKHNDVTLIIFFMNRLVFIAESN